MLDIDMEIRKGIMFVRLTGEFSKKTVEKWNYDVEKLFIDNGIKNVVFNMTNLTTIDMKGINKLYYSYEICKENKGMTVMCGINDSIKKKIKHSRLLNYIFEVDNELSASKMIKI